MAQASPCTWERIETLRLLEGLQKYQDGMCCMHAGGMHTKACHVITRHNMT